MKRAHLALAVAAALAGCQDKAGDPPAPPPVAEPDGYLGPTLELDAPARGALLDLGDGPVKLTGRACDPVHGVVSATLLGAPLVLGPGDAGACRAFSAEVAARPGVQVVGGEVVNAAGQRGTLASAFLAAPDWFDTGDGVDSAVEHGILVRLGQDLVDDGDRTDSDDVATVVETVLRAQDLEAAVGEVRIASPDADGDGNIDTIRYRCVLFTVTNRRTGFVAWKDGPLTHRGITVDRLSLEDGGLSARLTVWGVRVPFGVTGNVDSGCLGDAQDTEHGDVTVGALTVETRAALGLDAAGEPTVGFTSTSASLRDLDIDLALGRLVDWTGLGSLMGDAIEGLVRGRIQVAIRDGVRDALGERLRRVLPALGDLGGAVTLPDLLGGGTLVVDAGIDLVDFTAERAVVGARVRVRPEVVVPGREAVRGAMRLGSPLPDPAALAGSALAFGVEDDVLNQVLHAAWRAGAFDVRDLAVEADGGTPRGRLTLAASLPPVVMPRKAGAPGVEIGWGDLGFDLALEGPRGAARVKGFLSVLVGLEGLAVDGAARTFRPALAPEAEVHVQVTSVDWDHPPTTRRLTEGLVEGLLASQLADLVAGAAGTLALPSVDLGRLDPGLPAITVSLDDPRALRLERYHLLAGTPRPLVLRGDERAASGVPVLHVQSVFVRTEARRLAAAGTGSAAPR